MCGPRGMAKALMFLGTSSESGKSVLAAAFCRILKRKGIRVAPFKAQNMALNSGVTPDGREMGRAQIVQAEAAGIEPHVDMNPVLLKPTSERGSQVIVHGIVKGNMDAAGYYREKRSLWPLVTGSYDRLAEQYECVILEGAGSPVEINLKKNDIVNMAMAQYADAAAVLIADIDRGGVFASIVGTVELLEPAERERLIGFIINKFRGDADLLQDGLDFIKKKTGYPVLGVLPMIQDLYMPGEDSVSLASRKTLKVNLHGAADIGVIRLPHLSNYTDFDPLECDPRFHLEYFVSPDKIENYDAVIIPGSKNVFFDYQFLSDRGFKDRLEGYYAGGGRIVGICGGLQMMGESISDPHGVESDKMKIDTLGIIPAASILERKKVTERVKRMIALPGLKTATLVEGYEIHMGQTRIADRGIGRPLAAAAFSKDQACIFSESGKAWGTYIHGIFDNDEFRDAFLEWLGGEGSPARTEKFSYGQFKEKNYNLLADTVERYVDVSCILKRIGIKA